MVDEDTLTFAGYEFRVHDARFGHVSASPGGPEWDFEFRGDCLNDDPDLPLFPFGAALSSEIGPIPLAKAADYTGVEVVLSTPFDEESGEPYFDFYVMPFHDVLDMHLRFEGREGERYLIAVSGTIAETVMGRPEAFHLRAWATELPDRDASGM